MNPIAVPDAVKAARPDGTIVSMGPPPGVSDADCGTAEMLLGPWPGPLPGFGGREQFAYYRPSTEEVAHLARGGFLEMCQIGSVVQPFSLAVWPPDEVPAVATSSATADHTYAADSDPLVLAERARQVLDKGYTPEHDDQHSLRDLAACADERLANLINAYGELAPDTTKALVEVRAVMLALIESADRRLARISAEVERLRRSHPELHRVGDERLENVRVIDLLPGDVVRLGDGSACFIARTAHPVYPTLQMVVWRLHTGEWSHDALDPAQVVGDRDEVDDDLRAKRLRFSFGTWPKVTTVTPNVTPWPTQ